MDVSSVYPLPTLSVSYVPTTMLTRLREGESMEADGFGAVHVQCHVRMYLSAKPRVNLHPASPNFLQPQESSPLSS